MEVLTKAANILDVSEFEVLRRAYAHWYGNDAPGEILKNTFAKYLRSQELPHWAKHYAMKIIQTFEAELQRERDFIRVAWLLFVYPKLKNKEEHVFRA